MRSRDFGAESLVRQEPLKLCGRFACHRRRGLIRRLVTLKRSERLGAELLHFAGLSRVW